MKIITSNPVMVQTPVETQDDFFSAIDASSVSDVRAFQRRMNELYNLGLETKGKWDHKTKKAYQKYGKAYEQELIDFSWRPTMKTPFATNNSNLSATDPSGKMNKGHFWDKAKGAWVKVKDSGLLDRVTDTAKNYLGLGNQGTGQGSMQTNYNQPAPVEPDAGGSKINVGKIALWGGVGLLLIGGIYMLTRKKAAPAAPAV